MQNMEIDGIAPSVDQFVDSIRDQLIQRVSLVMPLADVLKSKEMLQKEAYAIIKAEKTPQDKMRALYDALDTEGRAAKAAFYEALKDQNPHLVKELVNGMLR
ncbi:NACHT, LRR and PYD domains-containing protein 1b allele 3-like [Pygocentrus nattereri]|uniref:NACHT, LRR and PYD domains-containing protein 1b allele 3-like n=1 Tax=Pygocentrus nattereri TaxID=42514 RepID=UPI000814325D|nr:NACHT, LRR and PYD domains-containing protein 1b allele 3-like [Pygocentrus nattereri]XP_037400423.1 NACHT, LRR and PYD domains-containing protein 1b allele 3-like [Pygocentrus nattereri]